MIDTSLSLTQLQTFVAVSEQGSFSGAARLLGKAQSAVSHSIGQLEKELGVTLFDRSHRTPELTEAGLSLLDQTKEVLFKTTQLQTAAQQWSSSSRETSFSLVVDMLYPLEPLVSLIGALRNQFPSLHLAVHTEARGAVTARILDKSGQLGVTGLLLSKVPVGIEAVPLGHLDLVAVVAPNHPLAGNTEPLPLQTLRGHTQLVLDDRSQLTTDHQVGVVGANNWKIGSQLAKHRFLVEGFGWGAMPWHTVREDVSAGRLVCIQPASWSSPKLSLPIHIIHRSDQVLGEVAEFAVKLLQLGAQSGALE